MKDSTRRTLRTLLAALISAAAMAPVLVSEAGLDPARWPWLAGFLAVCAVVTRVMASPVVESFLAAYVPWLAQGVPQGTDAGRNWGLADGRHELGRDGDAGGSA